MPKPRSACAIGRALIGKYVDDAVSVQVAAGTRELTILSLEFPSGEVGESGGETIADAMLAAQQALAESPSVDGDEDAEGSGENAEAEA
mgnify:CR=1 FL=1